MEGLA